MGSTDVRVDSAMQQRSTAVSGHQGDEERGRRPAAGGAAAFSAASASAAATAPHRSADCHFDTDIRIRARPPTPRSAIVSAGRNNYFND